MKREQIQEIQIHFVKTPDGLTPSGRVNEFYIALIEQRLRQSGGTKQQKLHAIDAVRAEMKARETDGMIV